MSINSPVTDAINPSMYANDLFNSQAWRSRSTGSLADDASYTFEFGEDGAAIMDGVYFIYSKDSADIAAFFTVGTSGTVVTILVDYGTDFVANGTTTNDRIQIDADASGLTIVNRLTAAQTLELVKLL